MRDPELAFTKAYEESYPDVLRFVRRRVGDEPADDVVAEVFTVAWRHWSSAPHDIRPWLFGIAHKVMAQDRRARNRRTALQLRAATQPVEPGDGEHAGVDAALDLQAAWAQLSDKDREAIALVAWDGLTGQQAAKVLGCTRSTFAVRVSRARRRLRAALQANEVTEEGQRAPARPRHRAAVTTMPIVEGDPL
jgi:RNA polymerase sigma-70 factor (ECF subfamily)